MLILVPSSSLNFVALLAYVYQAPHGEDGSFASPFDKFCDVNFFFNPCQLLNIPCGDSAQVLHTPIVPQLPQGLNSRAIDMD